MDLEKAAVIVTVCVFCKKLLLSVLVKVTVGPGQVPHCGRSDADMAEEVEKSGGDDEMLLTHQLDKFWSKLIAALNILFIDVTFSTFQLLMS